MSNIKITIEGVEKEYRQIEGLVDDRIDVLFLGERYREVEPVKQDYEIMSFMNYKGNLWEGRAGIFTSKRNVDSFFLHAMLEYLKSGEVTIHSVKRLSDGEVFIVGEQIRDFGTISKFIISDFNEMILQNTEFGGYRIFESAVKVKQPTILLKTEDGIDIMGARSRSLAS